MKRNDMIKNTIIMLFGDSHELGINDYNVRVHSPATIIETPAKYAKKVLVRIDNIDGDNDVNTFVFINKCRPFEN